MPKPPSEWGEDYILALPLEDSSFERKPSSLVDLTLKGADKEKILHELARQLSAFSNTGGGTIIYGLTNAGEVDRGGVSRVIKGSQSCKEWLEDVIPRLTDFPIVGVDVYEVVGQSGKDSKIHPGKAVILVSVPDSDGAPHQSTKDLRYYVRLGSHSEPAPHRLIEDIRNRSKHPRIVVANVELEHVLIPTFPRGARSFSGNLAWIIHDFAGEKRKGALKDG
jgi:Putative DNA-binding domain